MGCVINAAVAISSFCAGADEGGDGVRDIAGGELLINQLSDKSPTAALAISLSWWLDEECRTEGGERRGSNLKAWSLLMGEYLLNRCGIVLGGIMCVLCITREYRGALVDAARFAFFCVIFAGFLFFCGGSEICVRDRLGQ